VRPPPSWFNRQRQIVAAHVARLSDQLAALTGRLRETITQIIAQTAACAVRDALNVALADARASPSSHHYHDPPRSLLSESWRDQDRPYRNEGPLLQHWQEDEPDDWPEDDEDGEPLPEAVSPSSNSPRYNWHNALAIGCQAAGWWLRKAAGKASPLVAFGVGCFCTGATYVVGVGLASSVLGLMALADTVKALGPS
jgi:hypothetical protein